MDYIQNIDLNILLFIQDNLRYDWATAIMKAITFLGNAGWFWIVLSIALIIPKKTRKIGIATGISIFICFLITNVALKNIVARIRPYDIEAALTPLIAKPKDFSFPSGHTTVSFAASLVLIRMCPKKFGIPSVVLACLIAFSRLYLGVHYPTDVLGGILVAVTGSIIAVIIFKKLIEPKFFEVIREVSDLIPEQNLEQKPNQEPD